MSQSQRNQRIIQDAWKAFASHDADQISAVLTEDAEWLAPPGNATAVALDRASHMALKNPGEPQPPGGVHPVAHPRQSQKHTVPLVGVVGVGLVSEVHGVRVQVPRHLLCRHRCQWSSRSRRS
ncbi:hypothetical protein [Streptomyces violaceusniger]|uniref:hypothetical protein n=1 Tax=Streptomyces violaceusniger TaxID=68280 RepID=UPI0036ABE9ED